MYMSEIHTKITLTPTQSSAEIEENLSNLAMRPLFSGSRYINVTFLTYISELNELYFLMVKLFFCGYLTLF